MMKPVVLFAFYGRRANVELQLPLIARILDDHPDVTFEAWDFCRTDEDAEYLRMLDWYHDRFLVRHNVWQRSQGYRGMNTSYRHYSQRAFAATTFVKIDDDVVFLETDRFGEFLDVVKANPDHVISADVVNNGACSQVSPALRNIHRDLGIDLLDVHLSAQWGAIVHEYALAHWDEIIGRPMELVSTEDWLSINVIGYTYPMALRMAQSGIMRSPNLIAGREFPNIRIGDEGMVNTLPRMIFRGFTAVHLTFGPQKFSEEQLTLWRKGYRELGERYLR